LYFSPDIVGMAGHERGNAQKTMVRKHQRFIKELRKLG
jgi:hypothetical protein